MVFTKTFAIVLIAVRIMMNKTPSLCLTLAQPWTVYEWIGSMGVSRMTRVHTSLGGTRRIHGHPLVSNGANGTWEIRPEFGYALFGTPFDDGVGTLLKARGGREN